MKKNIIPEIDDELRPEYELSQLFKDGVRGKYAQKFKLGTNLVLLEPDVASAFPDQKTVNETLRLVMRITKISSSSKSSRKRHS